MQDVVEVYEGSSGKFYWHRRNGQNKKIVSDSGQGYAHKSTALHMAKHVHKGLDVKVIDIGKFVG